MTCVLRYGLVLLIAGLMGLTAATSPASAEAKAEEFVSKLTQEAIGLVTVDKPIEAKREDFEELLGRYFDMDGIGKFMVGKYWRSASQEEQEAFQTVFRQLIVYTYTNRFNEYSGQELRITGSRDSKRFKFVDSVVFDPNGQTPEVNIEWRLVDWPDDTFKIADVKVEGVSMSVTQRQEYLSVLGSNGGDLSALTQALNKQLAQLNIRSASGS